MGAAVFHDPVRHGEGWFRGAMGTGVSGVVMVGREAKGGARGSSPEGDEG